MPVVETLTMYMYVFARLLNMYRARDSNQTYYHDTYMLFKVRF